MRSTRVNQSILTDFQSGRRDLMGVWYIKPQGGGGSIHEDFFDCQNVCVFGQAKNCFSRSCLVFLLLFYFVCSFFFTAVPFLLSVLLLALSASTCPEPHQGPIDMREIPLATHAGHDHSRARRRALRAALSHQVWRSVSILGEARWPILPAAAVWNACQ